MYGSYFIVFFFVFVICYSVKKFWGLISYFCY